MYLQGNVVVCILVTAESNHHKKDIFSMPNHQQFAIITKTFNYSSFLFV